MCCLKVAADHKAIDHVNTLAKKISNESLNKYTMLVRQMLPRINFQVLDFQENDSRDKQDIESRGFKDTEHRLLVYRYADAISMYKMMSVLTGTKVIIQNV